MGGRGCEEKKKLVAKRVVRRVAKMKRVSSPDNGDIEKVESFVDGRKTEKRMKKSPLKPNPLDSQQTDIYDVTIMSRELPIRLGFSNHAGGQQHSQGGGDQESQRMRNEMNLFHVFDGRRFINERPPRRAFFRGSVARAMNRGREEQGGECPRQQIELDPMWWNLGAFPTIEI